MGYCNVRGEVSTFKPKKWQNRAHRLQQHTERLIGELVGGVDVICMESPAYHALKFVHTTVQLGELRGVLLQHAWEAGVTVFDIAPKAVKKFATGNGNASKDQVMDAAVMHNSQVGNDDEADAWWLWVIGMIQWNHGHEGVLLTDERKAVLAAIDWKAA
jgi:Holliday junction resolvasome RuvABC endonuclease subunit